jgi:patatin-like phospholipase/acyl hydrolase
MGIINIGDYFDIVGGTSCGSILAAMILRRFSFDKMHEVLENAKSIFNVPKLHKFSALLRRGHMYD